jgi:peptidoglycan hydrolase-like protein with peptidoglycan-binding domain
VNKFVLGVLIGIAALGSTVCPEDAMAGAAPIGQLNMNAVPNIDRDGIRKVQTTLKDKGFDPGPVDGVEGPRTTSAVKGFQERFGIKASGDIDNQTLFALGAVDLAAPGE